MSLYDLAADLFQDINRVRASELTATDSWRDPTELELLVGKGVKLPKLRANRQDTGDQTPTLDILAGCLEDIHQVRVETQLLEQDTGGMHDQIMVEVKENMCAAHFPLKFGICSFRHIIRMAKLAYSASLEGWSARSIDGRVISFPLFS